MEIESYDRCHIGIKLKSSVDLNILKGRIEKKLLEHEEYKSVGTAVANTKGEIIRGIISTKNDVEVELNYKAYALNTVGKDPISVLNVFKEVTQFLLNIGYDTEAIIPFYEIITNMNVKSNNNPQDLLSKSLRISLSPLGSIEGMGVTGISISNGEEAQEDELFNLIIGPDPTNPKKRFAIQVLYRSNDIDDIALFQESLESKIAKIIQSIEGE